MQGDRYAFDELERALVDVTGAVVAHLTEGVYLDHEVSRIDSLCPKWDIICHE